MNSWHPVRLTLDGSCWLFLRLMPSLRATSICCSDTSQQSNRYLMVSFTLCMSCTLCTPFTHCMSSCPESYETSLVTLHIGLTYTYLTHCFSVILGVYCVCYSLSRVFTLLLKELLPEGLERPRRLRQRQSTSQTAFISPLPN